LWADQPEYEAALTASHYTVPPVAIDQKPPVAPPVLVPGVSAKVKVSFIVDETGKVAAARILESTDSRFDQAALDAVRTWKFKPAEDNGVKVKSFLIIPINFDGAQLPDQLALNFEVGPPRYDIREFSLSLPIKIAGPGATSVRAARAVLKRAEDDTGAQLGSAVETPFFQAAVGSTSPDNYVRNSAPTISVWMMKPATTAKALRIVEGILEIVFPPSDPNSIVHLSRIVERLSSPIGSAALAEAGITLSVFDRVAAEKEQAESATSSFLGLQLHSDLGTLFGKGPPDFPPGAFKPAALTDSDLILCISDPQEALVATEFQTSDNQPVRYNHNGWSHFQSREGNRVSVYRLSEKPTADLQLVCWLKTEKSLVKIPLKLENIPLPSPPGVPAPQATATSTPGH
jgi:protein TonB